MNKMIPESHRATIIGLFNENGRKATCSILGNSMAPLIRHGDTLVIEYGNQSIRKGDVLVFKTSSQTLAHRVVQIQKKNGQEIFMLKGDHASTFDDPITRHNVIGKVIEVEGANGNLRFNTFLWKFFSYFWATFSYISGRRLTAKSSFWKWINLLFILRYKIIPKKYSIKIIVMKKVISVFETVFKMQRFGVKQDRRSK